MPDASVDRIIAAEVLEHIPDDAAAMAEIARVLKPGGRVAVSVPRWLPERICWALSDAYHANEGGHIRIYRGDDLRARLAGVGLEPGREHHAHALHAPVLVAQVRQRGRARQRRRPRLPPAAGLGPDEAARGSPGPRRRLLDPLIGKSLVVYADKPAEAAAPGARAAGRRPPAARTGSGPLRAEPAHLPELPGVLSGGQVRQTVGWIADQQDADGALPWFRGGQLDPWDSVEAAMALDVGGRHDRAAAAYRWLAAAAAARRLVGGGVPGPGPRPPRGSRATTPATSPSGCGTGGWSPATTPW